MSARRLTPASIPPDWLINFSASQLTLDTLNISKVPALADNVGRLQPSAVAGDEAYVHPQDLMLDDIDREAAMQVAERIRSERSASEALAKAHALMQGAAPPAGEAGGEADDNDDDDDAVAAAAAATSISGTPCVSVRLANNHISRIDAHAFKQLPQLRALDLSTNHVERLSLSRESTPRLMSLSLRNNRVSQLSALASAGLGGVLRFLDVSLNRLGSLSGVGQLLRLRVLVASGNQINGELPRELRTLRRLVVLDLSHNQLDGQMMQPLGGLVSLSTLRLAHNQLPARALPTLSMALGGLTLRRLELFSNPLALDPSFPEVLTRVQPALCELDHVRLPVGLLGGGVTSRRSVGEAIDSIAKSALAQHTVLLERQKAAHEEFLAVLRQQLDASIRALDEYKAVTTKAEQTFSIAVGEAKRARAEGTDSGGALAAVDAILGLRQALLTSEHISQERYRTALSAAANEVREALQRATDEAPL